MREAGRKAVLAAGDIQDPRHCEQLVNSAFDELGGLDILINNAAFQMTHESIEDLTPEEWDKTFRTNIFAMFYLCRTALPKMKAGSTIVNTTSVSLRHTPVVIASARESAICGF